MATLKNARALLRHYRGKLLRFPNVVGVSIGRKETGGTVIEGSWVLRIHVSQKTKSRTKTSVPATLPAPKGREHLGSIETDVIETGPTELHGPIRSGSPLVVGESGTIGCVLRDDRNRHFLLTAGHVIGRSLVVDRTRNGELALGAFPDAVVDGLGVVGIPVRCSRKSSYLDLGLVLLLGEAAPDSLQVPTGTRDARSIGERLKSGERVQIIRRGGTFRTSFHAGADVDGCVTFDYPLADGSGTISMTFTDVVFYPRESPDGTLSGGDSGSAVLDGNGRLIGIHIGASTGAPTGGDAMLLGYAIPVAEIRKWAGKMQLVCAQGVTPL